MSIKSITPADQIFLVMGMENNSDNTPDKVYVVFAAVEAKNQTEAGKLFLSKNPNFELMSVTSLAEMKDAVELLTFVQERRDLQPSSTDFPIPVYRENDGKVDIGKFGL